MTPGEAPGSGASPQTLARWLLRASALAFAGIGAAFLIAPTTMGHFVDVSVTGVTADNDVRGVYGGLQIACGTLLWSASQRNEWLRPGLRRAHYATQCHACPSGEDEVEARWAGCLVRGHERVHSLGFPSPTGPTLGGEPEESYVAFSEPNPPELSLGGGRDSRPRFANRGARAAHEAGARRSEETPTACPTVAKPLPQGQ